MHIKSYIFEVLATAVMYHTLFAAKYFTIVTICEIYTIECSH